MKDSWTKRSILTFTPYRLNQPKQANYEKTVQYYTVFVPFFLGNVHGQYVDRSFFKAGFHAGVTIGDASDYANLGVGLDLYQHWGISRKMDLGITAGFINFFGLESTDDIGPDSITTRGGDTQFAMVGGLFRFYPSKLVSIGSDVGYALGVNSNNEGGFYYRPTLSIGLSNTAMLNFTYTNVDTAIGVRDISWTNISAGVIFLF